MAKEQLLSIQYIKQAENILQQLLWDGNISSVIYLSKYYPLNSELEQFYFLSHIFVGVAPFLMLIKAQLICCFHLPGHYIFLLSHHICYLKTGVKHCTVGNGQKVVLKDMLCVCVCTCSCMCIQYHFRESYRCAQKVSQGTQQRCHSSFVFGFREEDVWYKGRYSACRLTGLTFDLKASHLPEEDGAEQEDGIEKQQTQTQPAVQPPVVQMNTRHRQKHRCQQQDDRIYKSFIIYGN